MITTEAAGIEAFKRKVFDINGALRFELNISAHLRPSPSGKYFCNVWDEISEERPTIYDRHGNEIKRLDEPRHSWDCRFLDDEHLLVFDPDTVRFIAPGTGDLIRVVPLGVRNYPLASRIGLSGSDSVIAIYNRNSIVLLSIDGKELWRDNFDDYLRAVAFDHQSPWMALQFEIPRASTGYIEVVSVLNPAVSVKSAIIRSFRGHLSPILDVFRFTNGVITVWRPSLAVENFLRSDVDYRTLFMEFDADSMSISQPEAVPGLYRTVGDHGGPTTRYLRAKPHGAPTLFSIEPKDKEVGK